MIFCFSAAALDEHHPLSLVAWNQTVSDVLLQAGDILGIQQFVEETQPRRQAARRQGYIERESGFSQSRSFHV